MRPFDLGSGKRQRDQPAQGRHPEGDFIGTEVIIKGFLAKDGTPTVNASSFTLVELKKEYTSDEATPGRSTGR